MIQLKFQSVLFADYRVAQVQRTGLGYGGNSFFAIQYDTALAALLLKFGSKPCSAFLQRARVSRA